MIRRSCGSGLIGTGIVGLLAGSLLLLGLLAAPTHAAIAPGTVYGTAGMTGLAGEVHSPEGISVDPISGRIALADYFNSRISIFTPEGAFVRAFGKDVDPGGGNGPEVCTTTCKAGVDGSGAGELSSPYDAEYSPSGKEIFVADYTNKRVSVFSAGGDFLRAFGKDVDPGGGNGPEVCTTATGCKAGVADNTGGSFSGLFAIRFGPDGLLYAVDNSANRIDVYEPNGTWLRTFGSDVINGGGTGFEVCTVAADCKIGAFTGEAALWNADGVDFDPKGRIWATAGDGDYVFVFDRAPLQPVAAFGKDVNPGGSAGFEVCTVPASCQGGTSGDGPGEFATPHDIGIGGDGVAYVASANNSRVNAYGADFDPLFSFGADVIPGGATGFEICRASCKAGLNNAATGFDYPYAVSVDCRGIVYVTNDAGDVVPARAYGEPGAEPGPCKLRARGAKANKRKGTAKLKALVPYPAKVTLSGKSLKPAKAKHKGLEGLEKLAVKPKGKLKRKLKRKGKAKVKAKLKMAPTDGNAVQTETKKLKLKRK